jgi:signal transduction histidine kinase
VIEQAIDQLPSEQRGDFSLEGDDPQVMADAPYLRQALVLLLQHLRASSNTPTSLRLETLTTAQIWLSGPIDPKPHDPLAQVDQLVNSTDASRGRQAVTLLRLALSRALIELHGGQWGIEQRSGDEHALCITLPLAHEMAESD